jgi:hypothetical protein
MATGQPDPDNRLLRLSSQDSLHCVDLTHKTNHSWRSPERPGRGQPPKSTKTIPFGSPISQTRDFQTQGAQNFKKHQTQMCDRAVSTPSPISPTMSRGHWHRLVCAQVRGSFLSLCHLQAKESTLSSASSEIQNLYQKSAESVKGHLPSWGLLCWGWTRIDFLGELCPAW